MVDEQGIEDFEIAGGGFPLHAPNCVQGGGGTKRLGKERQAFDDTFAVCILTVVPEASLQNGPGIQDFSCDETDGQRTGVGDVVQGFDLGDTEEDIARDRAFHTCEEFSMF